LKIDLSPAQEQALVEQFEESHRRSQQDYDTAIRAIAGGAVAVTASLAAAKGAGWSGSLAVSFSLGSLFANLLSYWTAQFDNKARIKAVPTHEWEAISGGPWRRRTTRLNAATGILLVLAGISLVWFVSTST